VWQGIRTKTPVRKPGRPKWIAGPPTSRGNPSVAKKSAVPDRKAAMRLVTSNTEALSAKRSNALCIDATSP